MDKEQSLGEFRMGKSYNDSYQDMVDDIGPVAVVFIDLIGRITDYPDKDYSDAERGNGHLLTKACSERNALKEIARRKVEEAAMWAVKATTKE